MKIKTSMWPARGQRAAKIGKKGLPVGKSEDDMSAKKPKVKAKPGKKKASEMMHAMKGKPGKAKPGKPPVEGVRG